MHHTPLSTLINNLTVLANFSSHSAQLTPPLTSDPFYSRTMLPSPMVIQQKYRMFSSHDIKVMHFYFDKTHNTH